MLWLINEQKRNSDAFKRRKINAGSLSIGRGTNQHIQSTAKTLGLHHATLVANGDYIEVNTHQGSVTVNGKRCSHHQLKTGDTLQAADVVVRVESIAAGEIVLHVTRKPIQEKPRNNPHRLHLETTWLNTRLFSWLLFISIGILFLALPILAIYNSDFNNELNNTPLPDVTTWDTGPVHRSHEHLQCNDCHAEPFALTKDEQCLSCHTGIGHHVPNDLREKISLETTHDFAELGSEFAETLAVMNPRLADLRCATCHHEHNPVDNLTRSDQALCSDCHARLDHWIPDGELRKTTDFLADHPEFRYTVFARDGNDSDLFAARRFDRGDARIEHSGLKFPHDIHLDPAGVKAPDGLEVLECANCHQPDKAGMNMLPIQMEQDCQRCHNLSFDPEYPDRNVPHGDPTIVAQTLTEYFSYKLLADDAGTPITTQPTIRRPGTRSITTSPQRAQVTLAEARDQAEQVMQDLLERRACNTCHEVAEHPEKTGLDRFEVLRVELTDVWLPKAEFNHVTHKQSECSTCHEAATSDSAMDVLMPPIATCHDCHGGGISQAGDGLLASDCLMCHSFHYDDLGPFRELPATTVETGANNE